MSNPFHGDVLFVYRPTGDGRRIKADATIGVRSEAGVFVNRDDATAVGPIERVGTIDAFYWPDGHTLTVAGSVDLPPGDYPCGVTLHPSTVELPPSDLTDDGLLEWLLAGDTIVVGGTVRELTVYVGDDAESKPAWPGTHITVTEGATTP